MGLYDGLKKLFGCSNEREKKKTDDIWEKNATEHSVISKDYEDYVNFSLGKHCVVEKSSKKHSINRTDDDLLSGVTEKLNISDHHQPFKKMPSKIDDMQPSMSKAVSYTQPSSSKPPNNILPLTSKPPNNIQPMSSKPSNNIQPLISKPPNNIQPMSSKPSNNIQPLISKPPNNIQPMSSKPSNNIRPLISKPPNNIQSLISKPPQNVPISKTNQRLMSQETNQSITTALQSKDVMSFDDIIEILYRGIKEKDILLTEIEFYDFVEPLDDILEKDDIENDINDPDNIEDVMFQAVLNHENYLGKFNTLLEHEKMVQKKTLFKCNRESVGIFEVRKNIYKLEMILTETNKVSVGDRVLIKCGDMKSIGEIYKIHNKSIQMIFKIKPKFGIDRNTKVSVFFIFDDNEFRDCKNALRFVWRTRGKEFLFPEIINQKIVTHNPEPCWVNQMLNKYQKKAVTDILFTSSLSHPYIIYGPPGTGKTTTVVETIIQIYKHYPSCKMLVVAPSNAAVDNIAEKIWKYFNESKIIRLTSRRQLEKVDKKFYSLQLDETKTKQYTVVLTTCRKSASLQRKLVKQFSHIIIDESGQATEPETLLPLLCSKKDTQVILAGDPKQLGPYVESEKSATGGLKTSFLERLTEREVYKLNLNGKLDDNIITLLKFNYRSIKNIVDLASGLYYDNMLLPVLNANDPDLKIVLNCLKHKFPKGGIYFKNINGISEMREKSSYNMTECNDLVNMYKHLLNLGLKPHHIGIITPYAAQNDEISFALQSSRNTTMPEVGTVERYQGREKDVILISTVRTDKLGFTTEPKRINVMITRSRVLTVIFGHEKALTANSDYAHIIKNSGRFI